MESYNLLLILSPASQRYPKHFCDFYCIFFVICALISELVYENLLYMRGITVFVVY